MRGARCLVAVASVLLSIVNAGCTVTGWPAVESASSAPAFPGLTLAVRHPEMVKYYPSDQPLRLGLEHFHRGQYGLAERYFQDAVEKAPKDVTAWVGLAACYDRLRRFDLADRAYGIAVKLAGETTEILNDEGYSYMLRGDLVRARRKFRLAQARDPHNPIIANNLKLLNGSYRDIHRAGFGHP